MSKRAFGGSALLAAAALGGLLPAWGAAEEKPAVEVPAAPDAPAPAPAATDPKVAVQVFSEGAHAALLACGDLRLAADRSSKQQCGGLLGPSCERVLDPLLKSVDRVSESAEPLREQAARWEKEGGLTPVDYASVLQWVRQLALECPSELSVETKGLGKDTRRRTVQALTRYQSTLTGLFVSLAPSSEGFPDDLAPDDPPSP